MIDYVRPAVVIEKFRADDGTVIPYGSRWLDNDRDGPDETYSVTKHPERFQPFVDVAHAIVEHLATTYDVLRDEPDKSTVVLRPPDPTAAPLRFEFNSFPGVNVTAGVATGIAWFCACDHCDEEVTIAVEQLEQEITAVVDGGLREWLNDPAMNYAGDDLFQAYALRSADGELDSSGSSEVGTLERQRLRVLYADVPPRWAPWSLRHRSR